MNRICNMILVVFSLALPGPVYAQQALPDKVPVPANNPMTPEKIELGKQLYFDPRLSSTGTVSCNTCHNVMAGGDDSRSFSAGVKGQLGDRSAPTVWNAAFQTVQFWDGRAPSLEEQAKGPLINPVEMGMKSHDIVVTERVNKVPGYQAEFKKVFGKKKLNIDEVAQAIATYERTLITRNSPFDRYIKGDKKAMSEAAIKGFETFKTTGCIACHSGYNFSGPALPMGTAFFQKFPTFPNAEIDAKYEFTKDPGRAKVTKKDADRGMFRVPTLRNIALTAPYFHNGKVKTLDEAIRVMAKLQLNKDLPKKDIASIATFLKEGLTGEFPTQTMPHLPETPGMTIINE